MSAKAASKKPKKATPKKGKRAKTWVRTDADQPTAKRPRMEKTKTEAAEPKRPPGDGDEMVVFAFRLLRSERDEIHAAVGSGKASRFVKAVALAAARGDPKTLEAAIQEAEGSRRS